MNKLVMLAGLAVMGGTAFAADNMGSWPTDWSTSGEAQYRTAQVLTGGEQNQLWSCLRFMPGDEQFVMLRAMNKAAADNSMSMGGGSMKSGGMMDSNWYSMSYMDRCKHDITDGQVWNLLVKNTPDGDRGVLGTTWWKLTDDAQHAIIKTVKRSWAEMAPTSDQVSWYK